MPNTAMAQSTAAEPYAVLSDDGIGGKVLTFYYDDQKTTRSGMDVGPFNEYDEKGWNTDASLITTVDFNSSFADYSDLTSTAYWFYGCTSLTTINNISNLKTENVTNMHGMFGNCSSLANIDLSSFNTANVTDMSTMFDGCSSLTVLDLSSFNTANVSEMWYMLSDCNSLKTVYVGSDWSTSQVTSSTGYQMFYNSSAIVGGEGTTYSGYNFGYEYAHIDGGSTNPGYFTDIADKDKEIEAYAVLNDNDENVVIDDNAYNGITLTFYYDKHREDRSGFLLDEGISYIGISIRKRITKVIFHDSFVRYTSLTSTSSWFNNCTNLKQIEGINYLKTDNVTDMRYMFNQCSSLTSLDVSGFNTDNVKNMEFMFADCSSLSNLDVSGFKTDNVINMESLFRNLHGVYSLDVSGFKTDNVTTMCDMFYDCYHLTSIDVSGFNTENVTTMDAMFYGCYGLNSLNLQGFNTGKVISMRSMFENCSGLNSLDISHFNTGQVLDMYAMFRNCSNLATINVSSFNTEVNNSTAFMFYGCTNLSILDISSFKTYAVREMNSMFQGCTGLTTIYVSDKWSTYAVGNDISKSTDMFTNCSSLVGGRGTEYNSEHTDHIYAHIDGVTNTPGYFTNIDDKDKEPYAVLSDENTKLTFYYDKNKTERGGMSVVQSVSASPWNGYNTDIVSVVFDDSFAGCYNLWNTARWFYGCSKLESITGISNLNTDKVTSMERMFDGCSSLTSLDVSNLNTAQVTDMTFMFEGCSALTSLDVTNFNTANVTNMVYMFAGCSGITELNLSSFNTANVTDMTAMFSGCTALKTIYVDENSWSTSSVTDGDYMFWRCTNLCGGMGTTYNMDYVEENYAHIDGGTSNPGYFTDVAYINAVNEPYAVLVDNEDVITTETETLPGKTLTFYYDKRKAAKNGLNISGELGWESNRSTITSVVFDDSFANYTAITSTANWFLECRNLTSITGISNLKTDNVTDMSYMFDACEKLTNLDVSGFVTDNVTNMSNMFAATAINFLNISNFKTDKVTNMSAMFRECRNLISLYLDKNNFKTDNVTNMWLMFKDCGGLISLDVSGFNTAQVTDMTFMFHGCSRLTTLDVSGFNTAKVTTMEGMFNSCSGLTILDLSSFNTTLVTNMMSMFSGCTSLATIYVSDKWSNEGVAEGSSTSTNMFYNCTSLVGEKGTRYDATHTNHLYAHVDKTNDPGYFTDNIPMESYAVLSSDNKTLTFFYDKNKADRNGMSVGPFTASNERGWYSASSTIETVAFDESFANCTTITSTAYWFDSFSQLTTISNINRLNTENVTSMERMFIACGKLTRLDLSGFNTANVTDMSEMFSDCTNLTSLNVSSFNTGIVTDMERMFRLLQHVESLDLSSFNTAAVTNMNNMFYDCNALKTILVSSDGWSTAALTDSENMFANCLVLVGDQGTSYNEDNPKDKTYAHIDGGSANPGYLTDVRSRVAYAVLSDNDDYVTINGNTFKGKTLTLYYDKKKEVNGGVNLRDDYYSGWGMSYEIITSVIFDESFANCTSLTSTANWFYDCKNLTSITGISNLKTDNVTNMAFMFCNCESLTTLDVSGFKTENVTNMSHMFLGCWQIAELDVSHFNTANVTNMAYMFYLCRGLLTLDVSNFDTSKVTDMNNMFNDCGVTSLDVSNFNTANVTNMEDMFMNCGNLTSLDLSNFDTGNVVSMQSMFNGCHGLTSLNLNVFNTAKVTNMNGMFLDCQNLTGLNLGSFNTSNVTNMYNMFSLSSNLTTIAVGDGWSTDGLETEQQMFYQCTKLVGGLGTMHNENQINSTYAHIDGGSSNPGYFTDVNGVVLTAKDCSREYGAANPTFEYTATGAAIGGTPTITCDATATSPVGTYPITVSYTKAEGESALNVTCVNGTLTITKAPLKVTAKSYTIKRGGTLPTFEVEYAGFKNNETEDAFKTKPTITCEAKPDTVPGTYQIVVSGAEADNYEMEYVFGSLTITDDAVVTANSYSRVYGDDNPTFAYSVDGATLSGTPSITCAATATSPVGTYDIVIAKGDVTNSEVTYVNGTLTITKAPLTVTAKSYTIKQGKDLPTFEVEYAGFKNNETEDAFKTKPTITCEAKPDTVPGTYQIVVSGAEADNYEMEYVFGSLTITDDAVVTANSYSRVYGDDNPTFAYSVDGATLSGTPSITCAATATSPVGTYDIVIAKGDVTNSEVTYVNGTLTITKAPLTITAKSYTIKQGKDLPTLEVEYSGFKNNETDTVFTTKPVVSTTATKYSEPGLYDIMVKDAEAANYEITYVKGTLTITKKTETYDGSSNVLTVEDGGNIDDALEAIGGREEAAKSIAAIVWKSTEPLTTEMLKGLDNPNMLIYVQSKEQAPKDRNNVVINGVAKYVELTDAGTGNHNFYAPVEFVAESITYTREFKQATRKNVSRGWEGICLPFTVQTFTHESHGEIAPFGNSASNYHFWLHLFTEDGIVNAETIEANKPYLISMPNSYEYYEEFNQAGKVQFASANVTIPVTETIAILLGDSAHIVPTFQVVEKSASVYTLNVGDSIISTLEGSIFVNNYRDVRPFEIYTFHEPNRNAGTRAISVSSLFGGGTTGIIDVMEKQNSDEVKVYSINGTLIKKGNRNEVMNSLPKGLYIIGNQKVMVK